MENNLDTITIFLKDGHTIKIVCEDWKFKYNEKHEYIAYEIKGVRNHKSVGFSPSEIVGYVVD